MNEWRRWCEKKRESKGRKAGGRVEETEGCSGKKGGREVVGGR